jgi:hypothetical protein
VVSVGCAVGTPAVPAAAGQCDKGVCPTRRVWNSGCVVSVGFAIGTPAVPAAARQCDKGVFLQLHGVQGTGLVAIVGFCSWERADLGRADLSLGLSLGFLCSTNPRVFCVQFPDKQQNRQLAARLSTFPLVLTLCMLYAPAGAQGCAEGAACAELKQQQAGRHHSLCSPSACLLLLQVRRAVLRLLPKLPMLSSSSSTAAGGVSSSMQYPKAVLQSDAAAAAVATSSHSSSVAADAAGSSQQMHGSNQNQAPEQTQQETQDSSSGGTGVSSDTSSSSIAALLAPLGPCPICSTSEILVPFVAHPCRHVFCYYCLQSHCAADSEFQCPVDGVRVDALQRYVRAVPAAPS